MQETKGQLKVGRRARTDQAGAGQAYKPGRPHEINEDIGSVTWKKLHARLQRLGAERYLGGKKMKNGDVSEAERWRTCQAKVLLESLCVEIEPGEKFEDGGVMLIVDGNHSAMQCSKCGEKWDVDTIMLKNGLTKIQAFVPWGLGYRLFFSCPHGCNKAYSWKETFQWISILKDID